MWGPLRGIPLLGTPKLVQISPPILPHCPTKYSLNLLSSCWTQLAVMADQDDGPATMEEAVGSGPDTADIDSIAEKFNLTGAPFAARPTDPWCCCCCCCWWWWWLCVRGGGILVVPWKVVRAAHVGDLVNLLCSCRIHTGRDERTKLDQAYASERCREKLLPEHRRPRWRGHGHC